MDNHVDLSFHGNPSSEASILIHLHNNSSHQITNVIVHRINGHMGWAIIGEHMARGVAEAAKCSEKVAYKSCTTVPNLS